MQLDWHERREFEWLCTGEDGYVLAQIKHYPTGWKLSWRPHIGWSPGWSSSDWPDTELEEAKAWAIAMIRMSQ